MLACRWPAWPMAIHAVLACKLFVTNYSMNRMGQTSEEHTSELQSPCNLVCRLLLEKQTVLTVASQDRKHDACELVFCPNDHSASGIGLIKEWHQFCHDGTEFQCLDIFYLTLAVVFLVPSKGNPRALGLIIHFLLGVAPFR